MVNFFKDLLAYSHHYNQMLGNIFEANQSKTLEKSVTLYNHMLNAHQIWNNRIEPRQPMFGVWELHPIENCKNIDKINHESSLFILEKFDLNSTVKYKDTKISTVRDILFHVINHSTYHRGQIATEFRQKGLEPLVTDYIFYKK